MCDRENAMLKNVDGRIWCNNESTGGRWVDKVAVNYWLQIWLDKGEKTVYECSFALVNSIDSIALNDYLLKHPDVFAANFDDNYDFCNAILGMPVSAVLAMLCPANVDQ